MNYVDRRIMGRNGETYHNGGILRTMIFEFAYPYQEFIFKTVCTM